MKPPPLPLAPADEPEIALSLVTPRQALGLAAFEKEAAAAHAQWWPLQEQVRLAKAESAAVEGALNAAREALDNVEKKDRAAKQVDVDIADAAAKAAAQVVREAVRSAKEANTRHRKAVHVLKRQHAKLSSEMMMEEAAAMLSANRSIMGETRATLDDVRESERRFGATAANNGREERAARRTERATYLELRTDIDPQYNCDLKSAKMLQRWDHLVPHHPDSLTGMKQHEMRVGVPAEALNPLKPPARSASFKYPERTPPLPHGVRLHQIAKFKAGDKMVMDATKPGDATCVLVKHVELGDVSLAPNKLSQEHEAVYLVETNSTLTTRIRGRTGWVNEGRLQPRPSWGHPGHDLPKHTAAKWLKNWEKDESFVAADKRSALEAANLWALEHKKMLEEAEAAENGTAPRVAPKPTPGRPGRPNAASPMTPEANGRPMPRPASAAIRMMPPPRGMSPPRGMARPASAEVLLAPAPTAASAYTLLRPATAHGPRPATPGRKPKQPQLVADLHMRNQWQ